MNFHYYLKVNRENIKTGISHITFYIRNGPVHGGPITTTIVAHPEEPFLYVSTNKGDEGNSPAATVTLNADGSYKSHAPLALQHGYAYLSLDRDRRFLLL